MVDSTRVSLKISEPKKIRAYYSIFLNVTAAVARSFGAKLVKSAGDAIIFYFPETTDPTNRVAFRNVLECCATIIASRDLVNMRLHSEGIGESINFRISANYGTCQVASSLSSRNEDLFGPAMNICAKINAKAGANMIVLGEDLYCILKALSLHDEYKFKEIGSYSTDNKHSYLVYAVHKYDIIRIDTIGDLFNNFRPRADPIISTATDGNKSPHYNSNTSNNQPKKSRTIILIDDEPDILLVYKSFLSSDGYSVEVYANPQEALAYFKFNHLNYDLALIDIRMPHINGFQLYKKLQTINKDVRVVFVTALEIADELLSLLPEIRNNDILRKPVSKELLLQTVKSKLDRPISIT